MDVSPSFESMMLSTRQRNEVRLNARRDLRDCPGDLETARVLAQRLNRRDIGRDFLEDADKLSDRLLDYWHDHGICEPSSVFVTGEPGCEIWDD